jgi:hypothetical protein
VGNNLALRRQIAISTKTRLNAGSVTRGSDLPLTNGTMGLLEFQFRPTQSTNQRASLFWEEQMR